MEKRLKRYLDAGKFVSVPEKRSKNMSAIKGKNNRSTELRLRMALIRNGIRGWKLHAKELPGSPDFFFEGKKVAIFVDGCFWHGCPKCGHIPNTRSEFWENKIKRTQQRDRLKRKELIRIGIVVISIWEHELKGKLIEERIVPKILKILKGSLNESQH